MIRHITLVMSIALSLAVTGFASESRVACTTQVLSSNLTLTRLSFELDESTVADRAMNLGFGEHVADGLGEFIVISGHGQPRAVVTECELGAVLSESRLDDGEIPSDRGDLVIVGEPFIMHDLRVVAVNPQPVMRDASGALRAVRRLEVEIVTSGIGPNETDNPTSLSFAFEPVYRSVILNLNEGLPELQTRTPGRYLFIVNTGMLGLLSPQTQWNDYLDLKRRKGYAVQVVTLLDVYNAVGDSSANGIRNFVSQSYHDASQPSLDYAMLVGDVTGLYPVPSYSRANPEHDSEYSVGDNDMFAVDGDDYISDVLHGRVCGQTLPEMLTYFYKVWRYETDPYRDDLGWLHSVTCIAGNYNDAGGTFPVTPVWNMVWARERLMRDGCITDADTFFYHDQNDPPPGFYTQPIINDINAGVCAVFYRGWADGVCWQYPRFCDTNVPSLTLGRRNPAIFGVVCGSARFDQPEVSLGEKFTSGSGTPVAPNGAVAYYGASDLHTNTRHNNAILAGIVTAALEQGVRSMGGLAYSGEMEAFRQFPHERDPEGANSLVRFYIYHVFNILGDPEVPIYFCGGSEFTVDAPPQLSVGQSLIPVTVTSNGNPVPGAAVTIRSAATPQLVSSARTDASGQVWLPYTFAAAGTAQVTVWRGQYFMRYLDIPVASAPFDPQITQVSYSAGDDYLPNPGETVDVFLGIRNQGSSATAYTINVTSNDNRATVLSGSATVENTPVGETRNSSGITVQFGSEIYDDEPIRFTAAITNGSDNVSRDFVVPIAACDPQVISVTVNDGGNGVLEPGETATLNVTVQNVGSTRSPALTAVLNSFDGAISFGDADGAWPLMEVGETATTNNSFQATLVPGVTPGRQILLRFTFSENGAVMARKLAWLPVGVITVNAPTGPDEYGYYAYENIDAGFAKTPVYNWIELDPWRGGSGATPHQVGDDTHFMMDLPAPFTFYGQTYNQIWASGNGWISFEHATLPEFRNWEIPSPIGPGAMICAFWDDLVGDSVGPTPPNDLYNVYTRYDAPENRFIISWRNWNRENLPTSPGLPNPDSCAFEIILEYTPSGDDDIVVQYRLIANTDRNDNYGSVGIQDSYHARGLGLTYANFYPATVDTLRAGRAIRFTTTPPDNITDVDDRTPVTPQHFALHEPTPNPFNPMTELRFELAVAGPAQLIVYDMLGRSVRTLVDDSRAAGTYSVSFDGTDLSTGLYFARLTQGNNSVVRKLMLVK